MVDGAPCPNFIEQWRRFWGCGLARCRVPARAASGRHSPLEEYGSISGQLTFPRYTLVWFVHALDAIFELVAVVRKLLSHLIDAAWHVATERVPDGDNLADFELMGGHRFLDLGR